MPARKILSPREKRVLSKMGLMPFTTNHAIAKRFNVEHRRVYEVVRKNPRSSALRMEKITAFSADPAKKNLLMHPRLWAFARICELAPTLRAEEIVKVLQKEQAQFPHLKHTRIPPATSITKFIKANNLRTDEQHHALDLRRVVRKQRNNLTPEQRNELIASTSESIRRIDEWARKTFGDEFAEIMRTRIEESAEYCRVSTDMEPKIRIKIWQAFLRNGRQFLVFDSLRQLRKEKIKTTVLNENETRPSEEKKIVSPTKENPFHHINVKNLTPRQRRVVELLSEGNSRKEIAKVLGTTVENVQYLVQKIRERIRK